MIRRRKVSFLISFIYVLIGTIAVYSGYPDDPFYFDNSVYLILVTCPVSFFSFGYRFFEPEGLLPVIIIQLIMFTITFYIFSLILKK